MVATKIDGIVTRYKSGYSFIRRTDTKDTVFVHQSAIIMPGFRSLVEGEQV